MTARTARSAIVQAPHRFLLSWWPWRALLYLVAGVVPPSILLGAVHLAQLSSGVNLFWISVALLAFLVAVLGGAPLAARWARSCAPLPSGSGNDWPPRSSGGR